MRRGRPSKQQSIKFLLQSKVDSLNAEKTQMETEFEKKLSELDYKISWLKGFSEENSTPTPKVKKEKKAKKVVSKTKEKSKESLIKQFLKVVQSVSKPLTIAEIKDKVVKMGRPDNKSLMTALYNTGSQLAKQQFVAKSGNGQYCSPEVAAKMKK